MSLTIRTTAQIVRGYAAAVQAAATTAVSFVLGSLELARANAVAGVTMWLQSKIMQVAALTRASTSTSTDLDTFMADFGIVEREQAVQAIGTAALSRYSTGLQATVAPGAVLKTADGTQSFTVIADSTQTAWDNTLGAYVAAAGVGSINVTVQAVNAGSVGNINANTLTQIASGIAFDTCTNALAYTSGVDQERDAALLARFQQALQGLQKGIVVAAYAAIDALQQGIQRKIVENQTYGGQTQLGYSTVVISPYTSQLQQLVYGAVDAVRPMGGVFGVFAATQVTANIAVTVTAAAGYTHSQVATAVTTALQNFVAAVPLGTNLSWSEMYAVVWGVPGVAGANSLTLNGGMSDITATAIQQVVAGTVTVS